MHIAQYILENISADMQDALVAQGRAFEEETGYPVRMLAPNGESRTVHGMLQAWSGSSADLDQYVDGVTTDIMRDHGVTILSHSWNNAQSEHRPAPIGNPQEYPLDWLTHNRERHNRPLNYYTGSVEEIEAHDDGVPLFFSGNETQPFGSIYDGRLIFVGWEINSWYQVGTPDFDKLFFDPVREGVDPERRAEAQARRREQARIVFSTVLKEHHSLATNELSEKIGTITQKIGSAEEELVRDRANAADFSRQLDAILANQVTMSDEDIAAEWEKLAEMANVKDFSFSKVPAVNEFGEHVEGSAQNLMQVNTDLLWLEDPDTGRKLPLGEFRFDLNFDAYSVRMNNKTHKQRGEWDHPHVQNGELCAGDFRSTITSMLMRREIGGMVGLVFNVLRVVTLRDEWGGAHMPFWIDADDELRREKGWPAWSGDEESHPMLAEIGGDE